MLPPDYHIHTPLSKHASGEPEEYRAAAADLGLEEIGFSDHAPSDEPSVQHVCIDPDDFDEYRSSILAMKDDATPVVRYGIEADYHPACRDSLARWLRMQGFDYVIGSVHVLDGWLFDDPTRVESWSNVNVLGAWTRYFEVLEEMVGSGLFNIVGHPDLPKKHGHRIRDREVYEIASPVLDRILEVGMAVEINTSGLRRPAEEIYPSPFFLSLVAEREIPVTFGSDAHRPPLVGYEFKKALAAARDSGCTTRAAFEAGATTIVPV